MARSAAGDDRYLAAFSDAVGRWRAERVGYRCKAAVNTQNQLLEMLVRGRLQTVIGTDYQVDYELRDARWNGRIAKVVFQQAARTDLYIGFSRQRGLQAQYQPVSQALVQMQAVGWIAKAAQRYQSAAP